MSKKLIVLLLPISILTVRASSANAQENSSFYGETKDTYRDSFNTAVKQPDAKSSDNLLSVSQVKSSNSRKDKSEKIYDIITKPGWFAGIEEGVGWQFPKTGNNWGVGAGSGSTRINLGVSGDIRTNKRSSDKLLSWSVTLSQLFQHTYNVPGNDRSPVQLTFWSSLSPLDGDALNIYGSWRGTFGNDELGQRRVQNNLQAGIVYSFIGSKIIPDSIEKVNLPEKGFYGRIEPNWVYSIDGRLNTVETQAYLGWSDTYYPFTFAIEGGPVFLQPVGKEMQTILGSFLELGYIINTKTRAYLRYRPALSFGGSQWPAAPQGYSVGINMRF